MNFFGALLVLLAACLLASCSKKQYVQQWGSMEPTIKRGAVVEYDTSAYHNTPPARWDVVICQPPRAEGHWCFRIVGLPGEVIQFTAEGIVIDGQAVEPPPVIASPNYTRSPIAEGPNLQFPLAVPCDGYFVLGDNVSQSIDSRYWGALEAKRIMGKVITK